MALSKTEDRMAAPQWVLLNACLDTTVELAVVFVVVCLLCNLWATCAPRFKCAACVSVCVCVYGGMVSTKSMACIKH